MKKFTTSLSHIKHNHAPVFTARWFTGAIEKAPEDSPDSFYYPGSEQDDQILIYAIQWQGEIPDKAELSELMDSAISAIDHWITVRL